MTLRHWCTYADSAYLSRLKALVASMRRHCEPFELDVLCWDKQVAEWCESQPGDVIPWWSHEFLEDHPELDPGRLPGPPRTKVEHYWTCGPAFIADVVAEVGPTMYVDADIMFFSSPEPIFAEIGAAPAAVFPHNFAPAHLGLPGPTYESHHVFGMYNVGLVYVERESVARAWANECVSWCFDRVEAVPIPDRRLRYADQKYLDDWPEKFNAHVIRNRAACLGPWAANTRKIDIRDGIIYFGDAPLISYHFSSYKELPDGHTVLTRPEYQITKEQARIVYGPYIDELARQK